MGDENAFSRRDFVAAGALAAAGIAAAEPSDPPPVDYRALVSRADLSFRTPVSRSEEGLPIGNGRTGSLVWTTPTSLRFQVNRSDVFPMSSATNSFSERHTDYGSGCGYVDIDFPDGGDGVFAEGAHFEQHLSVFDGVATTEGRDVSARVLAWHDADVIAVEIDDRRATPLPVNIDLRMLRYATQYHAGRNWELTSRHAVEVQSHSHIATSRLETQGKRILLVQEFKEDRHYCASAVAIGIAGRSAQARYASETTVRLTVEPGNGRFTVLIGSAATLRAAEDTAAVSLGALDRAAATGFQGMLASNRAWWRAFWEKSFVRLHSADGAADFLEQNYTFFKYVMASTSRGAYPPRFGGLIWFTNGDLREWGAQQWWHNLSCYYDALPATGLFELMDPMYSFYSSILPACREAARQQWGSQGAHIPETTWFDGPEPLPEEIAAEVRDLYLLRKPWDQRSERFRQLAETKHPHNSRWNWKGPGRWVEGRFEWTDKGFGPFGEVNHIYSTGAKIAHLFWLRYLYTGDRAWLRDRAYPLIKDVAEFYRHHPKVTKDADGRYHIHDVNDHEPIKGAQDTLEEVTAMHYIFPVAARAAEVLGIDRDLQAVWKEYGANLTPIPTNDLPDAIGRREPGEARMWANGRTPVIGGRATKGSDHLLIPVIHYDLYNAETTDAEVLKVANATFDSLYPGGASETSVVNVLSRAGLAAAHLKRAGDVRHLVPNQLRCLRPQGDFCDWEGGGRTGVLRNRLTIREGPGDIEAQRLGRAAATIHLALLQGVPPAPGKAPVIHVFPAWPKGWDAHFSLLTAGAFEVTAAMRQGEVEFVQLRSRIGGECRIRNCWGEVGVRLQRDGGSPQTVRGGLLSFPTRAGEVLTLRRA